jgi:peptidoglycan/LPS O-acetylase OafA/YrhL
MLDDLNFGLLLMAEGLVLLVWGFESRIKRRALVGIIGVVTAITIGVVVPVVSGAREGFGSGGWLIVGAVMAVLLIVAGSNVSRYRTSFGQHLDRVGAKLEDWE